MIRIYADSKAEPVRCTNRRRGIWRITWDYQETETPEGVQRSYMEETFDHLPALAEIKAEINQISWRFLISGISCRLPTRSKAGTFGRA